MGVTSDPSDPRLTRGPDTEPGSQAEVYLVLSEAERAKGYVRPLRLTYVHLPPPIGCGTATSMSVQIAATYARDPGFYGSTWCVHCRMHRPVGAEGEFTWPDGTKVGT